MEQLLELIWSDCLSLYGAIVRAYMEQLLELRGKKKTSDRSNLQSADDTSLTNDDTSLPS